MTTIESEYISTDNLLCITHSFTKASHWCPKCMNLLCRNCWDNHPSKSKCRSIKFMSQTDLSVIANSTKELRNNHRPNY